MRIALALCRSRRPPPSLLALAALWLAAAPPGSTAATADAMQAVRQGSLLLRDAEGALQAAPTLATDLDLQVSGMVVHGRVTQRFANPGAAWAEGVYVFPLPEDAAVSRLRIRVGERIIEGRLRERGEARRTYQAARAEGRRAALLEQERPNLFTTSLANIAPGEEVAVEMEYRQTLHYRDGRFRLRVPLALTPRYIPGHALEGAARGHGWAPDTDAVPDASRITPPVHPGPEPIAPVRLRVELDGGVPLGELHSPSHAVELSSDVPTRATVTLATDQVPADRDFRLEWVPQRGPVTRLGVFREDVDGATHYLLMLLPPALAAAPQPPPREVIFVIDTSGSMHGESIAQARAALRLALGRLRPWDHFNVIAFNDRPRQLFPAPAAATADRLRVAGGWVEDLEAEGGTEMAPALHLALSAPPSPHHVRQVIFLTDGSVGNESALFGLIRRQLGTARLFPVGIGAAPNAHFMRRAARFGRGRFTYIGRGDEVATAMGALLRAIERPTLTGLRLRGPAGARLEAAPQRLPDLYAGEPLVLALRSARPLERLVLEAERGGQPWRAEVDLGAAAEAPGVAALWARRRIEALMDGLQEGVAPEVVRHAVLDLALRHRLVTRYTSFVAVESRRARPDGAPQRTHALPTQLPDGMDYQAVFGGLARTATAAPLHLAAGLLLLALGVAGLGRGRRRC